MTLSLNQLTQINLSFVLIVKEEYIKQVNCDYPMSHYDVFFAICGAVLGSKPPVNAIKR